MKAVRLYAPGGLDKLSVETVDKPQPGPGELLVAAHASSLNFHDYCVVAGLIETADGRIPMSDVAGEVVAVGDGVDQFAVGDQVMGTFFPRWLSGDADAAMTWQCVPGDSVDGYASEYVCGAQTGFTRIPAGYSLVEAATLPCAAVTAWRGLFTEGRLQPGDTVLLQGTGGVSLFALQLAKAAGATVIITSSSDAKLARARELGADHTINYAETPEWGKAAAALCPRGGVDNVIEVGGAGTLSQSIRACRIGGHIAMIGVLTGGAAEVSTATLMAKRITLQGVTVGSRADQIQLVRAIEAAGIRPVIDTTFALDDIADAFRHQASQQHFGKIALQY